MNTQTIVKSPDEMYSLSDSIIHSIDKKILECSKESGFVGVRPDDKSIMRLSYNKIENIMDNIMDLYSENGWHCRYVIEEDNDVLINMWPQESGKKPQSVRWKKEGDSIIEVQVKYNITGLYTEKEEAEMELKFSKKSALGKIMYILFKL